MEQNNQNLTDTTNKEVPNSLNENIQPITASNQINQEVVINQLPQKPKLGTGFTLLLGTMTALSIITIVIPLIFYALLSVQANNGDQGAGIAFIFIIPLFFLGFVVSFFNLVVSLIYLNKYQQSKKSAVTAAIVAIFSLIYILVPTIRSI